MPFCHILQRRWFLWFGSLFGLSIVAFMLVTGTMECVRIEREKDQRGKIISSQRDWPAELLEFVQDSAQQGYSPVYTKVYNGFEGDFFLQCDDSGELVKAAVSRWNLLSVKENVKVVHAILEETPSPIKRREKNDQVDFFVSSNVLDGEKGHKYLIMHNKTKKELLVWYYFNF